VFDVKKDFSDYFNILANKAIFSLDEPWRCKSTGRTLNDITTEFFVDIAQLMLYDPISYVSATWYKYAPLPISRRIQNNYALIKQCCQDYIDSREGKELKNNMFDYQIQYNRERKDQPDDQIGVEDFVGNFLVFMTAGTDTTRYASLNSTKLLAEHPDIQDTLRKAISESTLGDIVREGIANREGLRYEDSTSCSLLINFLYEVLRASTMMPASTLKQLVTDTTLGNYKLKKGDQVIISYDNFDEDASRLDLERFKNYAEWTSEEQMRFLPFSFGKRGCLGKNFAYMNYSLFFSRFLMNYKIEKGPNWSMKQTQAEAACYADYTVKLTKLR